MDEKSAGSEEDMLDAELTIVCAIRIQSLVRRYRSRVVALERVNNRYEKILDVRRKCYFYYDRMNDKSSWSKPLLLKGGDIREIAATYDDDVAACMVQRQFRRIRALVRVRQLYMNVIERLRDESTGNEYYYNRKSGSSMWGLPSFMHDRRPYTRESNRDDESAGSSTSEDEYMDSTAKLNKRSSLIEGSSIASNELVPRERKYPRSKAQILIDSVEDSSSHSLNLSGLHVQVFSTRLYDLHSLTHLDLSHNKLRALSSEIQYLGHLTHLNVSHNYIEAIPIEIEECRRLQMFDGSSNKLTTITGHFFRLSELTQLYINNNRFTVMPVEIGSLELLKELHEWEVSIGLLLKLTELSVNHCLIQEWPKQLERLSLLAHLDLSHNQIQSVSPLINKSISLIYLDLSFNHLLSFAPEILALKLQTLKISHNKIKNFAPFTEGQQYSIRRHLTLLDISHNELTELGNVLYLFYKIIELKVNNNNISTIHENICHLLYMTTLDISHNSLTDLTKSLKSCTSLVYINISYNKLTYIPIVIGSLLSLEMLDVSHNSITDVHASLTRKLDKLKIFDISYNQLIELSESIGLLSSLRVLNASHNQINSIHSSMSLLHALEELHLVSNLVVSLAEQVFPIPSLHTLNLDSNQLHCLPTSISYNRCLTHLSLSYNKFKQIPTHLLIKAAKLQHWDFSNNPIQENSDTNETSAEDNDYTNQNEVNNQLRLSRIESEMSRIADVLDCYLRNPPKNASQLSSTSTPIFLDVREERLYNEKQAKIHALRVKEMDVFNKYIQHIERHADTASHEIRQTLFIQKVTAIELADEWLCKVEGVDLAIDVFASMLFPLSVCGRQLFSLISTSHSASTDNSSSADESNFDFIHMCSSTFSSLESPVVRVVLDFYSLFASASLAFIDRINASIRVLERRGKLPSRLDMTQRRKFDYYDIVNDYLSMAQSSVASEKKNISIMKKSTALNHFEFLMNFDAISHESLESCDILKGVTTLLNVRNAVLSIAYACICGGAEILGALGWDPKGNASTASSSTLCESVPEYAKQYKNVVAKIYYTKGRLCQGLGYHEKAVGSFSRLTHMFPIWIGPFLEIIKCELCLGRVDLANELIFDVWCKEHSASQDEAQPTLLDIVQKNKELGVLYLYCQGLSESISSATNTGKYMLPHIAQMREICIHLPGDTVSGRSIIYDRQRALDKRNKIRLEQEGIAVASRDHLLSKCTETKHKAQLLCEQVTEYMR